MTRYLSCRVSIPWVFRVFYHTKAASESKIAREMVCFTIETVVGGREGRMFRTGRCVGFSWVSGGIRCFRWSNHVKSLANPRLRVILL